MIKIAVHGGAWNIPDDLWPAHEAGCKAAHEAGLKILEAGGTAVEAVAAAIVIMEDDPTFDAGYGSFLTNKGTVELDAGIMEGHQLQSGAALGVSMIKNPIKLAKLIMEKSAHCILMDAGAHEFAFSNGLLHILPEVHIHPREAARHKAIEAGDTSVLAEAWVGPQDTVGAIALDQNGNLAAGNSTGGTIHKPRGRIGDAPLAGVGFYADNEMGAVICTGWGESIIRSAMAMHALFALKEMSPQQAAEHAIEHLEGRVNGYGGLILMTPNGDVGIAHNTQRMAFRV